MHYLHVVVFAVVCVLLVDLGESKKDKMVANKTTKAKDNIKMQDIKDNKPRNALTAVEGSSGEKHAKGSRESSVEKTTESKANDVHKNTELHKSIDHKVKDKQKNQSKTKQRGDAAGKSIKADKNKVPSVKTSKLKDDKTKSDSKVSDKKNSLKSKTHKDSSKAAKGPKDESLDKQSTKNDTSKVVKKPGNNTLKSSNKTELRGQVPSNCNDIVDQYTNGKILMFEYKIKMKRCMTRKDVLATNHRAMTKSSIAAQTDAFAPEAATPSEGATSIDPVSDFSETAHASDYSESSPASDGYNVNTASNVDAQTNEYSEQTQSTNTLAGSDGQGIDPSYDAAQSMETIDQNGDQHTDTNEKFEDSKRTQLPAMPGAVAQPFQSLQPVNTPEQQNQQLLQQNPSANFYPAQDPNQAVSQPQVPTPEQAAVAPNMFNAKPGPDSFPQTPSFQDANPFAARSDVPNPAPAPAPAAAAPAQETAAQPQGVMDQWRSNRFGANVAKKDQLPGPNAQIAQFMNLQQPATNAQEQGIPQPRMQQRSDIQPQIPQQRNDIQSQPLQQSNDIQPQPLQQRSDIQPQPLPQQATFNQYPAGPENNLPL